MKTRREKLCNDDVHSASVLQQIIGVNQSKCENNLGYYIKQKHEDLEEREILWEQRRHALVSQYTNLFITEHISLCNCKSVFTIEVLVITSQASQLGSKSHNKTSAFDFREKQAKPYCLESKLNVREYHKKKKKGRNKYKDNAFFSV